MSTNDKPAKRTRAPKDLIRAAKSGDRLKTLIALRDLLAERLQHTESSRDISSMSRRLMQCISEIDVLEAEKKYKEEHPFDLQAFRKKMSIELAEANKRHQLNSIDAEHDGT